MQPSVIYASYFALGLRPLHQVDARVTENENTRERRTRAQTRARARARPCTLGVLLKREVSIMPFACSNLYLRDIRVCIGSKYLRIKGKKVYDPLTRARSSMILMMSRVSPCRCVLPGEPIFHVTIGIPVGAGHIGVMDAASVKSNL